MVVDRCLIDARFGDNRPNACAVIAPLGKQGDRGLHDVVARIFGGARHSHSLKFKQVFQFSLRASARQCKSPLLASNDFLFPPVILWSQTNVWISNDSLKRLSAL